MATLAKTYDMDAVCKYIIAFFAGDDIAATNIYMAQSM